MMMLLLRFLLLFWVVGGGGLLLIGVFVVFTLQSCGILVSLMGQGPSLSLTRSLVRFVYWCSCVCSLVWSRVSTLVALGSPCCLLPRPLVRSAVVCDCVANACGGWWLAARVTSHQARQASADAKRRVQVTLVRAKNLLAMDKVLFSFPRTLLSLGKTWHAPASLRRLLLM